jgi:hypothetical protein
MWGDGSWSDTRPRQDVHVCSATLLGLLGQGIQVWTDLQVRNISIEL